MLSLAITIQLALLSGAKAATGIGWFSPAFSFPGHPGSLDYMALFAEDASWQQARRHIKVFQLNQPALIRLSDSQLVDIFKFLKANKIALSLSYGVLHVRDNCENGVEGFMPSHMASALSRKIKNLGGQLHYLAMDEPLQFGHYYARKNACHLTIAEVAKEAGNAIQQFQETFPHIVVGDIEPVAGFFSPGRIRDTSEWVYSFEAKTHTKLSFYHFDLIREGTKSPLGPIPQLVRILKDNNVRFGIIFNSRPYVKTDESWMERAKENIDEYKTAKLPSPNDVVIQSWTPNPAYNLPESAPYTLTQLIDYYYGCR